MATKNCPHCQKQVPVACKKCGCGHVFFSSRRYMGRESSSECAGSEREIKEEKELEEALQPRRRTGRVQREKPNFYDALQYENQIRKQKLLLRKQVKTAMPEDSQGSNEESSKTKELQSKGEIDRDAGSSGTVNATSQAAKSSRVSLNDDSEPKKRRRGRPPGITGGRKPGGSSARIQGTMTLGNSNNMDGNLEKETSGLSREEEEEDIMADISPEKALQYNIVLQEINRKWVNAGWKATD